MTAVDASSLAKFALKEEGWEEVAAELRGGCVSLELATKEVGNAFWKAARAKLMDPRAASSRFAEFVAQAPFRTADQAAYYGPAFEISLGQGVPFYDALYIALAAEGGHDLVTSDRKQAKAAEKAGVVVRFVG